jgi:integrase/recombinase XerD
LHGICTINLGNDDIDLLPQFPKTGGKFFSVLDTILPPASKENTRSGARISEVLALPPASIDIESGLADPQASQAGDCPWDVLDELDREFNLPDAQRDPELANERIWKSSRMAASQGDHGAAGISGTPAMPEGLRHGFGVNAFQSNVPPHLVQRWLGHASLRTTYLRRRGRPDERAFAERMW